MDDATKLTTRQREILDMIRRHIADTGIPPTRSEIVQAFGFRSTTAAVDHLNALAKKGVIELLDGTARGIRLTGAGQGLGAAQQRPLPLPELQQLTLPLVGQVAAGTPILAQEHLETHYTVDAGLFARRPDYLLRVKGLSMRDAGILPGDLLAIHATREVLPRQIAVFRVDQEVTVKRFVPHPERIELQAANPDFESLWIEANAPWTVEGVMVGLIRDTSQTAAR